MKCYFIVSAELWLAEKDFEQIASTYIGVNWKTKATMTEQQVEESYEETDQSKLLLLQRGPPRKKDNPRFYL